MSSIDASVDDRKRVFSTLRVMRLVTAKPSGLISYCNAPHHTVANKRNNNITTLQLNNLVKIWGELNQASPTWLKSTRRVSGGNSRRLRSNITPTKQYDGLVSTNFSYHYHIFIYIYLYIILKFSNKAI
jgi:hypothetical protein